MTFTNYINTEPSVVTIGNFDGLHLGHQGLLNEVLTESSRLNYKSIVVSFALHTMDVLNPNEKVKKLMPIKERNDLIRNYGIDYLYIMDFDKETADISYQQFIDELLIKRLNCKKLIIGEGFKIGYKGLGTDLRIYEYLKGKDVEVSIVKKKKVFGSIVSSSFIRYLIEQGRVDEVKYYLGRNYGITGTVLKGKRIGRTINFPTVNFEYKDDVCYPSEGVYATLSRIDGQWMPSITNIGTNPTVKADNHMIIETNILNVNKDLYNRILNIIFLKKIRNEHKFKKLTDLEEQLKKDKEYAYNYYKMFYI